MSQRWSPSETPSLASLATVVVMETCMRGPSGCGGGEGWDPRRILAQEQFHRAREGGRGTSKTSPVTDVRQVGEPEPEVRCGARVAKSRTRTTALGPFKLGPEASVLGTGRVTFGAWLAILSAYSYPYLDGEAPATLPGASARIPHRDREGPPSKGFRGFEPSRLPRGQRMR